jgi:phage terminase large subunit-like protein
LVRSTIDHVLTPWQQIEVYSGLGFPSFGTSKAKFEKAFLMVLNNFGIK